MFREVFHKGLFSYRVRVAFYKQIRFHAVWERFVYVYVQLHKRGNTFSTWKINAGKALYGWSLCFQSVSTCSGISVNLSKPQLAQNNITYQLVRMGAMVTNNRYVGEDVESFTLESANGKNVLDIPAVYLYELSDTDVSYAVRITNIPLHHDQTLLYARPYYVYLFNDEEVIVYGDVYSQSYTPQDSNDVTMDW